MKTIVVSTPLCAPSRNVVTGTLRKELEPYHVKLGSVTAEEVKRSHWRIEVQASDEAAEWVEYLLLRLDYFRIGKCLHKNNQKWANKWLSQPTGYAPSCKDKPKNATVTGERVRANPPPPWQESTRRRQASLWQRVKAAFDE
jgi:hypothetical protein